MTKVECEFDETVEKMKATFAKDVSFQIIFVAPPEIRGVFCMN